MKVGALVPARIGSKRLQKKNIKILKGRPLICWTIDVLLESDVFYDITVSTESDEIAETVREYYSEREVKILKRPPDLAQDDSPLRDVVLHYMDNRSNLDWYGVFMPTFPFRKKEKIREAYNAILTRYPWKIISTTDIEYCLLDFYYPIEEGVKQFFRPPPLFCKYNLPVYKMSSLKYREELWYMYGLASQERVYRLILSTEETIDIDTIDDFNLAEYILNFGIKENDFYYFNFKEYILSDDWIFIGPSDINIDTILKNFSHALEDNSNHILILKENIVPASFLNISDLSARNYFRSDEAKKKYINEEVLKTQNMKYYYPQYRHSRLFRFLRRKYVDDRKYFEVKDVVPWDRIFWEKDLVNMLYNDEDKRLWINGLKI